MRAILDDIEKVIIRDHGSFAIKESYPASHYDGELPIGLKGGIEPPIKNSMTVEVLKVIVAVILGLTVIKIGWTILLHILPRLSQYISL